MAGVERRRRPVIRWHSVLMSLLAIAVYFLLGIVIPSLIWAFHDLRKSRDWSRFAYAYENDLNKFLSESQQILARRLTDERELPGYRADVSRLKENLEEWASELEPEFPTVARQLATWGKERGHSTRPYINVEHDGWQREAVRINKRLEKMHQDLSNWQLTPDNPRHQIGRGE